MTAKRSYEDFEQGFKLDFHVPGLSKQAIIDFASLYDPQPFHMDEAAAAKTHFGRLCASGFQTQVMCFREFCDAVLLQSFCIGSPGISDIKWLRPWYPDEPVEVEVMLVNKRLSAKREDRGYLNFKLQARVNDEPLMDIEWTVIILTRDAAMQLANSN